MAPINGTQPITVNIPNNTDPTPKKKPVKNDDICDHPALLTGLIGAAEDNGGDLPLYPLFGNSVGEVINRYNKTSKNTFTGTAYDIASNNDSGSFNPFTNGTGLVGIFLPDAGAAQLKMTEAVCADNATLEDNSHR